MTFKEVKSFKFINEMMLQKQIMYLNSVKEIEYLFAVEEVITNIGEQVREYKIKFKDDDEEYILGINDIPYKVISNIASYSFNWRTTYGRYFVHEDRNLNMMDIESPFKNVEDVREYIKSKQTRKEVI